MDSGGRGHVSVTSTRTPRPSGRRVISTAALRSGVWRTTLATSGEGETGRVAQFGQLPGGGTDPEDAAQMPGSPEAYAVFVAYVSG